MAKVQLKMDKNPFENEIIWKFENGKSGRFKSNFQIVQFPYLQIKWVLGIAF